MSLTVGEVGKTFRVAAGFDMSSNTELTLTFTKPDQTTVVKIKPDVVLGTSPVVDPDLGSLAANEYVEYEIEAGFLDQSGFDTDDNPWKVYLTYTNTTPDPDDVYIGTCTAFTVLAVCP